MTRSTVPARRLGLCPQLEKTSERFDPLALRRPSPPGALYLLSSSRNWRRQSPEQDISRNLHELLGSIMRTVRRFAAFGEANRLRPDREHGVARSKPSCASLILSASRWHPTVAPRSICNIQVTRLPRQSRRPQRTDGIRPRLPSVVERMRPSPIVSSESRSDFDRRRHAPPQRFEVIRVAHVSKCIERDQRAPPTVIAAEKPKAK